MMDMHQGIPRVARTAHALFSALMIALLVSAPAAQAQTADKPAVEGIKIRGHWVIEVTGA